ncbi:MAG: hypothetical protein K0S76_969 [Herbinix sp.]|jgi:hypothetical protein|nr:hypothetical protein [Herbinix sp.]
MKAKSILYFGLTLFISGVLLACKGKSNEIVEGDNTPITDGYGETKIVNREELELVPWRFTASVFEDGLFTKFSGDNVIQVYDFALEEVMPVCSRPDCTHFRGTSNYEGCYAAFEAIPDTFFMYKEKMYYLIFEGSYNTIALYKANKDGSNRQKLTDLEGTMGNKIFIYRDKLYYASYVPTEEDYDPKYKDTYLARDAFIGQYDLITGRYERLVGPLEGVMQEYNLIGIEENYVVFMYNYIDEEPGMTYDRESFGESTFIKNFYVYNLDTKDCSPVIKQYENTSVCGIYESSIFYSTPNSKEDTYTLYKIDLTTMEHIKLLEEQNISFGEFSLLDGKIFLRGNKSSIAYYDIKTGLIEETLSECKEYPQLMFETSNRFIGLVGDEAGFHYFWIYKRDLYENRWNKHVIPLG